MNNIIKVVRDVPPASERRARPEGSMQRVQCLSGSALKIIALLTMIIDHVGSYFLQEIPSCTEVWFSLPGYDCSLYTLSRLIGRAAFPLYCFLIAEGAYYTRNRLRYGSHLFLFALLSEIPWDLVHHDRLVYLGSQNVFFTLFMGFLCICIYDVLHEKPAWCIICLGLAFVVMWVLHADYGAAGMALIFLLYLLRDKRIASCLLGSCLTTAKWKAVPGFILVALYNGKRGFIRGKFMKYLFYASYPGHILILWLIKRHTLGY